MVVDDPLPYYGLSIEWLTVLVEDYRGYGPANLWPVLGMASLFGAFVSVQVLVGEARQAQTNDRTGDGSLNKVRSVVGAVRCAIEVQNGLIEHNSLRREARGDTRLFARAMLVGANIDRTSARRSSDVEGRRVRRIAGADRQGPGSQPEVVDELRGIKTDKPAGGAIPLDVVVVCIFAWFVDALLLTVHVGDDLAIPFDLEADVVIHRHGGVGAINVEGVGDIVADDHIVRWQAVVGLVADGDARLAGQGNQSVRNNGVVDDLAPVHAGEADTPTGAGHDDVVHHREVRPVAIEGVDALKIRCEWQLRIDLTNDPVAIDHDVFERHGGCRRNRSARIALHAVRMCADIPIHHVVDIVLRD